MRNKKNSKRARPASKVSKPVKDIAGTMNTAALNANIPETVPMETHAYHLHKAPGKGFRHYLFEFLMLFLAITLGFFVENQREHFLEHRRAIEYVRSLSEDFRADTAFIQRTIDEKEWISMKYDSVLQVIYSTDAHRHNNLYYYITKYLKLNDVFTPQDITYQQLRSSGNFRYIRNVELYKKIANYYNLYDRYTHTETGFGFVRDESLTQMELKLFNIRQLYSLYNKYGSNFYDLVCRPESDLEPVKIGSTDHDLFYLKVSEARERAQTNIAFLKWLKGQAVDVLNEIENEYHLAD
jgi:hypothetical protein